MTWNASVGAGMNAPTFEDWLDLMPLVANRGWQINKFGAIRDKTGCCPLCAFAKELGATVTDGGLYWGPLNQIGAPAGDEDMIAAAADLPGNGNRRALMQALGMEQP